KLFVRRRTIDGLALRRLGVKSHFGAWLDPRHRDTGALRADFYSLLSGFGRKFAGSLASWRRGSRLCSRRRISLRRKRIRRGSMQFGCGVGFYFGPGGRRASGVRIGGHDWGMKQ
ncbi:MAG: hypothetical protein WAN65_16655, partial [Candidatus Sulfotelmatobacter sp.]